MTQKPLAGIRVLDLTRAWAGPTATVYLAELGAEVIKIEATNRPDMPTRVMYFADNDPADIPWERSAWFHRVNVGKLGITLDLTRPAGVDLFKRLVEHADVVAENYRPGTMDRFGLDYEALSALNPRVILASMSGFGATGPHKNWASYYPGMESLSSLTSVTGYRDGHTLNSTTGYGDWALGAAGAGAILVALHQRHRSGRGQYLDVSGRDSLVAHLGEALLDHAMNGRTWGPEENRTPGLAPNDVYRCAGDDAWVAISVRDERDWRAFCGVLGEPSWTCEERFADAPSRFEHQDEMRDGIEAWCASLAPRDAADRMLAAGVPAAPVLDPESVLLDRQMLHRGFYRVVDHPLVGGRLFPRQYPAQFSGFPLDVPGPAPMLGQHGRQVLRSLLGLQDEELEALEADGIIGTMPTRKSQNTRPTPVEGWRQAGGRIDEDYLDRLRGSYGDRLGPPEAAAEEDP